MHPGITGASRPICKWRAKIRACPSPRPRPVPPGGPAEGRAAAETHLEIADDGLARRQELVHQDVPGTPADPPGRGRCPTSAPWLRAGSRGSRPPRPSVRRA